MNKKDYDIKYAKEKSKRIYLLLNKEKDKDIIEILEKTNNKQGFIKELIRASIK